MLVPPSNSWNNWELSLHAWPECFLQKPSVLSSEMTKVFLAAVIQTLPQSSATGGEAYGPIVNKLMSCFIMPHGPPRFMALPPSCRRSNSHRFPPWGWADCYLWPHKRSRGNSIDRHCLQDGDCNGPSPHQPSPQGSRITPCEHGPWEVAKAAPEESSAGWWACWGKGSRPPHPTQYNPGPASLQFPPKAHPCRSVGWCRSWRMP